MGTWAQELAKILQEEETVLSDLAAQALDKKQAIKNDDVQKIDHITNIEQPLVMQLQAAELSRMGLLRRNQLERHTLSELVKMADGENKQRLKTQFERLSTLSAALQHTNDLNNELIRLRLELYEHIRQPLRAKALYDSSGKSGAESQKTGLMDRKI